MSSKVLVHIGGQIRAVRRPCHTGMVCVYCATFFADMYICFCSKPVREELPSPTTKGPNTPYQPPPFSSAPCMSQQHRGRDIRQPQGDQDKVNTDTLANATLDLEMQVGVLIEIYNNLYVSIYHLGECLMG